MPSMSDYEIPLDPRIHLASVTWRGHPGRGRKLLLHSSKVRRQRVVGRHTVLRDIVAGEGDGSVGGLMRCGA